LVLVVGLEDAVECFLWVVEAVLLVEGVSEELEDKFHVLQGCLVVVLASKIVAL
jgi:hypothetical protein